MLPVRSIVGIIALVVALVVQLTVLTRVPLPGATPDLVLVVVVGLAIGYGPRYGAVAGFAAGFGLDVVPPAAAEIGRWALVLALVGYVTGLGATRLRRSILPPVLLVGGAAAAAILGYAAIGVILGDAPASWGAANRLIATSVLYCVVLSPFVLPALLAVVRRLDRGTGGTAGTVGTIGTVDTATSS